MLISILYYVLLEPSVSFFIFLFAYPLAYQTRNVRWRCLVECDRWRHRGRSLPSLTASCFEVASLSVCLSGLTLLCMQRDQRLGIALDQCTSFIHNTTSNYYFALVAVQSIAISVSVYPSVCLSARIPLKPHVQILLDFLLTFSVAVARSSSNGCAMRYVLPVLWMTSCFHIIARMGLNQRRCAYVSSS